jgi:SAM-dependent methyltransferase
MTVAAADPLERFRYIDPPFQRNADDIACYPAEVTGYHLLESLRRRLGWPSFGAKRLLDLGCGVRFAQTIYNLDLPIGTYAGVDTDADVIAWLAQHLRDDDRFDFRYLAMRHEQYNPGAPVVRDPDALRALGLAEFDAACMFSVITHQWPDDAHALFTMLRRSVAEGGLLYFTAFTDETVRDFRDGDPERPAHYAIYRAGYVAELATRAGWTVRDIYPKSALQQTAFVCTA